MRGYDTKLGAAESILFGVQTMSSNLAVLDVLGMRENVRQSDSYKHVYIAIKTRKNCEWMASTAVRCGAQVDRTSQRITNGHVGLEIHT